MKAAISSHQIDDFSLLTPIVGKHSSALIKSASDFPEKHL